MPTHLRPATVSGRSSSVPWWALVVSLVWGATLAIAVVWRAGDVSGPIHLGGPHVDPTRTPSDLLVQPEDQSYDGQFFYRLSVSPFSDRLWVNGVAFDAGALRAGRIGYPAAVWAVSLGDADRVPAAMLLVNVLATGAVGLGGAMVARRAGRPWFVGLVVLAVPGAIYGLVLDLADVVAVALVLFAVVALVDERWGRAAVLLAAAALTRESTLLIVASVGAVLVADRFLLRRPVPLRRWSTVVVPVVVFAVWQAYLYGRWQEVGVLSSGGSNFVFPFASLVEHVDLFIPNDGPSALRLFILVMIVVVVVASFVALPSARGVPRFVVPGLVAGSIMVASLGRVPFSNYPNFSRAATELVIMAALVAWWGRGRAADLSLATLGGGGVVLAGWAVWATTPLA